MSTKPRAPPASSLLFSDMKPRSRSRAQSRRSEHLSFLLGRGRACPGHPDYYAPCLDIRVAGTSPATTPRRDFKAAKSDLNPIRIGQNEVVPVRHLHLR